MMQEIIWACTVGGFLVAFIALWVSLHGRIQKEAEARTVTAIKAESAEKLAATLGTRMAQVVDSSNENRVALEVKIAIIKTLNEANATSISAAENRIAKALEDMRDHMKYLGERFDQLSQRQ